MSVPSHHKRSRISSAERFAEHGRMDTAMEGSSKDEIVSPWSTLRRHDGTILGYSLE